MYVEINCLQSWPETTGLLGHVEDICDEHALGVLLLGLDADTCATSVRTGLDRREHVRRIDTNVGSRFIIVVPDETFRLGGGLSLIIDKASCGVIDLITDVSIVLSDNTYVAPHSDEVPIVKEPSSGVVVYQVVHCGIDLGRERKGQDTRLDDGGSHD